MLLLLRYSVYIREKDDAKIPNNDYKMQDGATSEKEDVRWKVVWLSLKGNEARRKKSANQAWDRQWTNQIIHWKGKFFISSSVWQFWASQYTIISAG